MNYAQRERRKIALCLQTTKRKKEISNVSQIPVKRTVVTLSTYIYRYIYLYVCVRVIFRFLIYVSTHTHTYTHILQTSNALSPQRRRVQTRARQKQTVSGEKRGKQNYIERAMRVVSKSVFICVWLCKWVAAGKRGQFFLTRLDYHTYTHIHIYQTSVAVRTRRQKSMSEASVKKCVNRTNT